MSQTETVGIKTKKCNSKFLIKLHVKILKKFKKRLNI